MSKKSNDAFGDRVKAFESVAARAMLDENQPICVRIDGKAFHTYTQGLARPYDKRLSDAMIATMNFLVDMSDARLGYTQSDEISLVLFKRASHEQSYFGAREQKLTSVLASMATAKFNAEVHKNIPEKQSFFAFFDCRVWNVPSLEDAADVFIWRQDDAIKNSVSMAAHAYYGDAMTKGKSSKEKKNMLLEKGVVWDDYPEFFKSGTYAMRRYVEHAMSEDLKGFSANEGRDTYLRSEIDNFNLPRLRFEEDCKSFLFDPVFAEYRKKEDDKKMKRSIVNVEQ